MSARVITVLTLALAAYTARAEPQPEMPPEVLRAVERGVVALRQKQFGDGCWGEYGPGSTALVMIALLEANVPTTDPAIVKAAKFVRYEALKCRHTYSLALAILALDRLGEESDLVLIRTLARRLASGQMSDGGWSYCCPLGVVGELEKTIPAPDPNQGGAPVRRDVVVGENAISDNSNTQFAILALWVGHRNDVEVDDELRKAAALFRRSALSPSRGNIGWAYTQLDKLPSDATSCCGLLGLAVYEGADIKRRMKSGREDEEKGAKPKSPAPPRDPLKEQIVQDAFRYVTAQFVTETKREPDPHVPGNFYFLWSYERVAVAYGLDKTYGADWYKLGLRRILPLQGDDGLWKGYYGYEPETSFCLLFLCRSNLTRDLVPLLNPKKKTELRTDTTEPAPAAPAPPRELTVQELVKEFVNAPAEKREKLVPQYRDHKGVNYTEAIAKLIPKVDGIWPKSLRDALASRLSRMTAATLRERLKDADNELRRAAAVAAAMKEDKSLIPDLIAALDDREPWVVRAAAVALSRLTGQDFGPPPNAAPEQRAKSVAAWKEWWSKQPK